jgi:serine/threonine protein kinase
MDESDKRYELLEKVSEGAFGTVFRARDTQSLSKFTTS